MIVKTTIGDQLKIFRRALKVSLLIFSLFTFSQNNLYAFDSMSAVADVIKGRVVDNTGQSIPGAFVRLKDKPSVGTATDLDGYFSIDVPQNSVLIISYTGFETVEKTVTGTALINVVLKESTKQLNEVVVVGYGVQKRASITGAVASIQGEELLKIKTPNVTNMLAGKLPGLRAVQRSGAPGDDNASVDIRGYGSMLVIVDGVERDYAQIDPNDIASISILKDAAAAVYGFKGANGVLLVTSKKGTISKAKIDYSTYYSSQQVTRYPQFMNAYEYASLYNESIYNSDIWRGVPAYGPAELEQYKSGEVGTEWWDAMIKKSAPQTSHNLNVSGGTEKVKYYTSIGYMDQGGLLKSNDWNYDRYNFRSNIDVEIVKGLNAEMKISGRNDKRERPYNADELFRSAQMAIPIYSIYAQNNTDFWQAVGDKPNPVHVSNIAYGGYENRYNRDFNGSFSLAWQLPWVTGLTAKANIAYDYKNTEWKTWRKAVSDYTLNESTNSFTEKVVYKTAALESKMLNYYRPTYQYSLNYNKTFAKKHDVSVLALWEMYNDQQTYVSGYRENSLGLLEELDYGNALNQNTEGNTSATAHSGLVGRINYAYDHKYLVELSGRYDGTYKFRNDARWGFFPGVSVGWRVSEEPFFSGLTKVVENLKLRASYANIGDEGNPNDYPGFQYLDGFTYSGSYILGSEGITTGLISKGMANPWLTWYEANTYNLGLEASFLQGLFTTEFDWFRRHRTGLLDTRQGSLPTTFGQAMPLENLNSDYNTGFEISVGHRNKIGKVRYNVSGNFSSTRIEWDHHETSGTTTNSLDSWRNNLNGRYRDIRWGKTQIGTFSSFEEILNAPIQDKNGNRTLLPGDIKFMDRNGDGIIDGLDDGPIGRGSTPLMYYGLNLGLQYKGFDFTAFFQGAAGHDIYINGDILDTFIQQGLGNGLAVMTNRWHRSDPTDPYSNWIPGLMPAARIANIDNNKSNNSWTLHKADYLRLKTIELGYNLTSAFSKLKGVNNLRVYANANNLFTFTSNKGLMEFIDPENNSSGMRTYPQLKTFTVGLNLNF